MITGTLFAERNLNFILHVIQELYWLKGT